MSGGRPLRFVAMVALCWTGVRIATLWQASGSLPAAIRGIVAIPAATAQSAPAMLAAATVRAAAPRHRVRGWPSARHAPAPAPRAADPQRVQMAVLAMTRFGAPLYPEEAPPAGAGNSATGRPPPGRALEARGATRLSFSSWGIARSGIGRGISPDAPQLGGTQGGIRADYGLGRGLALTGRLAAPAAGSGREASLGIAWRPTGVPLRFVAEQRVALDGGRGGPALGVSGGVSELPLAAGFRLEGYAQGGAILRDGIEHYLDGSARAARRLASVGGITLDAGAGVWGGAQRGVARLDIGPSIGARVPIVGRTLRLSVDWRQRIAGRARPGSGPALSIGSDF